MSYGIRASGTHDVYPTADNMPVSRRVEVGSDMAARVGSTTFPVLSWHGESGAAHFASLLACEIECASSVKERHS